jgi:transposase
MSGEKRRYTPEYREQAVKLAKEIGYEKAKAELGIPQGTFSRWMRQERQGKIELGEGQVTPQKALNLAEELKREKEEKKKLEKEVEELKRVNEFLKEASRFFAASQQK